MIRLRAVGECVIDVGGERVGPDAELAFALLLVLTLAEGRPLGRRHLIDLLWPATTEARARHNLRQALYKLRQLGVPVETESNRLRLPAAAIVPNVLLEPELEGPPPAELLRPDVPFGEFLAGYAPAFSAAFAAWVDEQRGVMHGRLRRAVLSLLLDERRRGNWGAVETLARKCLQLDPLNEEATLALAEATALSGSKRAALAILDGYLHELGGSAGDIRLPATVLRRRIAERLHPTSSYVLGESCFLGRAESIAFLNEHFQACREHGGRAVLLWGDAGIGKSRLLTEFGRMATLEGAQVVRVGCQARDVERPLSIFVDAVPLVLALPGALGVAPESLEYLRRLTAHDPAVLEPSAATREAELLFASVRRALFDLVDAVAAEAPLLLCLEDLQWLDDQSWRVLRELIGWLDGRPVLVALSSRLPHATPAPPAREAPGLEAHRVVPLDQASSIALLDAITAGTEPPAAFRDWSIQVADGNPLLLRLLGGHWLEKGQMRAPASIERLFDDRVTRLRGHSLLALQACAVLGNSSNVERLEGVLQLERHLLLGTIAELEDKHLVRAIGNCVQCRHSLVIRSALRTLSPGAKVALHRASALVLESAVTREHSVTLLWECTHQWIEAGETARAIALARSCAAHMLEVGLPHLAAEAYDRILSLCDTDSDRIAVLREYSFALRLAGQWERLLTILAALQSLEASQYPPATKHSPEELLTLEASLRTLRCLPDLLARAERCLCDRNAASDHRIEAASLGLLFADNSFDALALERIYTKVQPILAEADHDRRKSLRIEAIYHHAVGNVAQAVTATDEWIRLERRIGDVATLSRSLRNATIPYRTVGLVEKAFAHGIESYELSVEHQLASSAANSADMLATLNLTVGDIENARLWLERAQFWAGRLEERCVDDSVRRVGVRLALLEGRCHDALENTRPEVESVESDSVARSRLEAYALLTAVYTATAKLDLVEQIIGDFSGLYDRARIFHGQDFATSALITGYVFLGRADDARSLADQYVSADRRERSPLSFELQRAIHRM